MIIIGAGGHGRVIADIAKSTNQYKQIGFLDDDRNKIVARYKVMGTSDDGYKWLSGNEFIVAVGDCRRRKEIQKKLEAAGCLMAVLIHPKATVAENVRIGKGSVVMANTAINTGSCLGDGVIVNTGSTIDHDCEIGNYVHIAPGSHVSGNVKIGSDSWVGVGSCIKNNLSICPKSLIGAGAAVVCDIEAPGKYAGIPAKKMSSGK